MTNEVETISADEARALLSAAIRERLGQDWDDEQDGWAKVTGHDYMVRLTKGRKNVDFYVDLLGNVTIEEKEINSAQDAGRLVAWMLLLASVLIALAMARLAGYL
ncbi:MAG: hypothetical protein H7Y09_00980 [Chitinophagaceae bacterium]|nr:hypothetical protein [Anaerolineae bacterium]